MNSDDGEGAAGIADVALEMLVRAYHALAVFYELSNPGAYAALHGKMMPYLRDGFALQAQDPVDSHAAERVSSALEQVRCALDGIRSDVAAVRACADEGTG
ncbi:MULTISPECIES: hypothetical protein [unclassified Methylobacterium]|jgi:hypothetical protein|uniref:hypothetical protein n=1 Tax=unclassified Methylobacterium TaxID=2615210 RepID=UPI0013552250|nr:hypothetical protein [Methylobacterium sp. 2A]MWV24962.1 hypothetical protein [Methylobacterium sp. 2A]